MGGCTHLTHNKQHTFALSRNLAILGRCPFVLVCRYVKLIYREIFAGLIAKGLPQKWVLSEVYLAMLFLGSHQILLVWGHQIEAPSAHLGGLEALLGANASLWCKEIFTLA